MKRQRGSIHVKLRKVAAFAAGAGLVAGMFVIGAGPAHAQTTLLEVDGVAGEGKLKPPLTDAPQNVVVGTKTRKAGPGSSSPVSADALTPWAALNGDSTVFVKGKVGVGFTDSTKSTANGGISCVSGNSTYSASGKLTTRIDEIDAGGKFYQSQAYIRLGGSPDPVLQPDTVSVHGIVVKGVGLGGDVDADLLQHPIVKKGAETDPSFPPSALQSYSGIATNPAGGGKLAPGVESAVLGQLCQAGFAGIDMVLFGTDGMSLVAFAADPAIAAALGDVQTECVTDPPNALCLAAVNDFAVAYGTAYALGTYDTDSSIQVTLP
jgi:hypothetical protein